MLSGYPVAKPILRRQTPVEPNAFRTSPPFLFRQHLVMGPRIFAEASVLGLALLWIYMVLNEAIVFQDIPAPRLQLAIGILASLLLGGTAATVMAPTLLSTHAKTHSRVEEDSGILVGLVLVPIVIFSRLLVEWAELSSFSQYTHVHLWLSLVIGTTSLLRLVMKTPWTFASAAIDAVLVQVLWLVLPLQEITSAVHMHMADLLFNVLLHYGHAALSMSFTVGEAMLIAQGVAYLVLDALFFTLHHAGLVVAPFPRIPPRDDIAIVLQVGLFSAMLLPLLCTPLFHAYGTSTPRVIRPALPPLPSLLFLGLLATVALVFVLWTTFLLSMPLHLWVFHTLLVPSKLYVALYWLALLVVVVPLCPLVADRLHLRQIVARKLYHFLAVLMFLPVSFYEMDMLRLSYGVAVAVFLVVECVRALSVPPFGRPIALFMRVYLDHRDEGRLVLSHIYLLLGCALPLWIQSAAPSASTILIANAGVLALGIGDAMGATVGSTLGSVQVVGKKTLEGSVAVFVSMGVVSLACHTYHYDVLDGRYASAIGFVVATLATAALEAITLQIDNLVLPLFYGAVCSLAACA
ncbi:Aste57867_13984 [Aphanomyces stellatus]|uniref:dolichol kinase n=1 Tax=Aphanomyces stellatus TaxID=120398 RepID=A0A485KZI4_9STRA|nr:hypothetical protein As57867_013933 [Aphanomyces stellatus]VFT90814.1 Aste57867_13984 [Aphanomyces stellatus]